MDWVVFAVQWLHVLGAILWFGATLYGDVVLFPAFSTLPFATQRAAAAAIAVRANRVVPPAALGVIVLGFLRGAVFGQVRSFDALATAYGFTWLVALVLAVSLFIFGLRVLGPTLERLGAISEAEALNPDGTPTLAFTKVLDQVKRVVGLELVWFLAIFTCMILMRFGL